MNAETPPLASPRGAVIALGNFDGVHLGHRAVIDAARTAAQARQGAFAVALFEPHPRRFFQPDAPPFRLQSSAQRDRQLRALGAARVHAICFDAAIARMSDEEFAREVLVNQIGAAHLCVGADFRYGRGRVGDAASLARLGGELGFAVTPAPQIAVAGAKLSSSTIRNALAAGDVASASAMLGRPWAIEGEVARGFQRGRDFGFPTANLALGDYIRPRLGIYAVRVLIDGARHDGVASIGINPAVGALPEPLLEAHIFDFDRDLYGQTIEVELIAFLREEAMFDDTEALKAQMARDAVEARECLQVLPAP